MQRQEKAGTQARANVKRKGRAGSGTYRHGAIPIYEKEEAAR